VEIEGMPAEGITVELKNHPNRPELGVRNGTVTPSVFIERAKFSIEDVKGYKGMTPGRTVRLMGNVFVTCTGYETDADGNVSLVKATLVTEEGVKVSQIYPREPLLLCYMKVRRGERSVGSWWYVTTQSQRLFFNL
jgi:hypothetical protein